MTQHTVNSFLAGAIVGFLLTAASLIFFIAICSFVVFKTPNTEGFLFAFRLAMVGSVIGGIAGVCIEL